MNHRHLIAALAFVFAAASGFAAERKRDTAPWSWLPLQPAAIPAGKAKHPIDRFLQAKLAENKLRFSKPAPANVLLRRASFDLTGLPPAGTEPREYEALLDHLLASPHYGERWARHWLDVVRFTESQGFEYDRLRENAWPYRDYVIAAFNRDMPYDQFVREQIAGDVLDGATADSMVATGMLVCGPWDEAGSAQANVAQRMTTREEELEDIVSAVSQTFLGATMNCARCHTHKFDPIPQRDYFRLKAVFEGVKHGERELPGTKRVAYVGKRAQPEPTRLLKRGEVRSPGDVVAPGSFAVLGTNVASFELAADAPEGERRKAFANWVAAPENPLTARVMVNRIWQGHFGEGLVRTPNDFGNAGARPAHAELLDWLAGEFIASGWSVKRMHKLIMTSDAYKQGSAFNPRAAEADAGNELLWRFTPRRLDAEEMRDAMLAISGELNRAVGGPSFKPFDEIKFNSSTYVPKDKLGEEFNRRTIYRMNVNSGKDPMLDVFDCPDPSVKTPRRNVTTTPLQALALMNNSFALRQAELAARRAGGVRELYALILGREPTQAERKRAREFVGETSLADLAWALFNSTEFLYVQ